VGTGERGKLFFHVKKSFPLSPDPSLFSKKAKYFFDGGIEALCGVFC
jgi:hypothetical protein